MLQKQFEKSINREAFEKFNDGLIYAARSGQDIGKSLGPANAHARQHDSLNENGKGKKADNVALQLTLDDMRKQLEAELAAINLDLATAYGERDDLMGKIRAREDLLALIDSGEFDNTNPDHQALLIQAGFDPDATADDVRNAIEDEAPDLQAQLDAINAKIEDLERQKQAQLDKIEEFRSAGRNSGDEITQIREENYFITEELAEAYKTKADLQSQLSNNNSQHEPNQVELESPRLAEEEEVGNITSLNERLSQSIDPNEKQALQDEMKQALETLSNGAKDILSFYPETAYLFDENGEVNPKVFETQEMPKDAGPLVTPGGDGSEPPKNKT